MSEPFARYGPPRRVEGGIKARSSRGAIGESWWSQRFLAVLESLALGSRLGRGRSYARRGQVLAITIAPGQVTATVQGSRIDPYSVTIGLSVLDERAWRTVESALADQAIYGARLLAGEMPHEIEDVFARAGTPLFPTRAGQLIMRCSCPDWQVPCKHLAATFYLLAEAFDDDPFEILHWRGRDRATLLDTLRRLRNADDPPDAPDPVDALDARDAPAPTRGRRRRTAPSAAAAPALPAVVGGTAIAVADVAGPDLSEAVERFWVSPVPLPPRPPTVETEPDLVLRQLPTPPAVLGGDALTEHLRAHYAGFADRDQR
jgi:uncharacterized Zn finger protein